MGILSRTTTLALLASSTACYEPTLRDCTVACVGSDACGDQVCGPDGYCVDDIAIRCATTGHLRDAGATDTLSDARTIPVDATPDAPTTGTLTLTIAGKGTVDVEGVGTCVMSPCVYTRPLSAPVKLLADPGKDFVFDRWSGALCPDDESPDCTFSMPLNASVSARFTKD